LDKEKADLEEDRSADIFYERWKEAEDCPKYAWSKKDGK